MPVNKYFDLYNDVEQQQLYRQLISEITSMYGIEATYLVRGSESSTGVDLYYGDDPTKVFNTSYSLSLMIENTSSFDGGDLFSKFAGLIINKSVSFLVANDDFWLATSGSIGPRPREGDLLWLPNFQALYEVKHVNQDKYFYAFGRQAFYGFSLNCEEYRYSNDPINTTDDDITNKLKQIATAYAVQLYANGNGTFLLNETVYQGGSNLATSYANATVLTWNLPSANLVIKDIAGLFTENEPIVGLSSNAVWTIETFNMLDNVNDGLDNNSLIEQQANTFIDWTEVNPQGNPTQ